MKPSHAAVVAALVAASGTFAADAQVAAGGRVATPVPEPAPFALFGIAIAVFIAARRYGRPRGD